MANTDVLFTFDEAVRTMGVTPEKLEKLIDEGKIAATPKGAGVVIPREEILKYFADVAAAAKKKK